MPAWVYCLFTLFTCFLCSFQREPELEFGAIYRAKIVEIRQDSDLYDIFYYSAVSTETVNNFIERNVCRKLLCENQNI